MKPMRRALQMSCFAARGLALPALSRSLQLAALHAIRPMRRRVGLRVTRWRGWACCWKPNMQALIRARRKTAAVWQTRSKGLATPFRIYAGRWKSAVCGRWSTKRSGRVISGWLEQSVIPYDGDSDGPCGGAEGEFSWVSALLSGEALFW